MLITYSSANTLLTSPYRCYSALVRLNRFVSSNTNSDVGGQGSSTPGAGPPSAQLVSESGVNDYEAACKLFEELQVPAKYNFARDVVDRWATYSKLESNQLKAGSQEAGNPALWFIRSDGTELKWSFEELSRLSKRSANVLKACGIKKGDLLLVTVTKTPEWWLLYLAAIRLGAIFCPGTSMLTSQDIVYRLKMSGAKHVICDQHTFPAVSQGVSMDSRNVTKILVGPDSEERPGWYNFNNLLHHESSADHQCEDTRSDEAMTSFFTSGTTGKPKIVEHTHASYGFAHQVTGKVWLDLTRNDIILALSDPGWAKAAWSNFFASWSQGSCIFIDQAARFCPDRTLDTLQRYPISVFCAGPTAYRMLVQRDLSKYKFPKLRHCVSAGEPLNPAIYEQWHDMTGLSIREGFGQTETVVQCGMFRCLPVKPGSLGKPAPGMNLKVINDYGMEMPRGEEGQIAIKIKPKRPVGLFKCYAGDEEKTKLAFQGDFYLTGDRAIMDHDGYLWFISRDDDIINSAGYRIGPFEVESVLIEHPAVVEAAVVSSPHPDRGEVVKAFVILHDDYINHKQNDLVTILQEYVKEKTAPYKYPRKIEFVKELPKTISGKTRRVELRKKEWERSS